MTERKKRDTNPEPQSGFTSISVSNDEADRIRVFAKLGYRNLRGQVVMWLEAHEALAADIPPEIRDKIDTIENLKPATEEGKGG